MTELVIILLLVALIILLGGVLALTIIIIFKSREESKDFKNALIEIQETNTKISSDINIRLISIVTEALLGSGPAYNKEIQEFDENLKNNDKKILDGIMNPQPSKPFDPFASSDEQPFADDHPLNTNENTETLLDSGAIYNSGNKE